MLPFIVDSSYNDRAVITNLGITSLTEYISRDSTEFYSSPYIIISGLTVSGIVDTVHLDLEVADTCAQNNIYFSGIPVPYSTINLDNQIFRFVPLTSGLTQFGDVHIGPTEEATAIHLYKVITQTGVAGVDYFASISTTVADPNRIASFVVSNQGADYFGIYDTFGYVTVLQSSNETATLLVATDYVGGIIAVLGVVTGGLDYSSVSGANLHWSSNTSATGYPVIGPQNYTITKTPQTVNVASVTGLPNVGQVTIAGNLCYYSGTATGKLFHVYTLNGTFITGTGDVIQYGYVGTHPTIDVAYADNPLILRAKTAGLSGNTLVSTTTDTAHILLTETAFFNGGIEPDHFFLQQDLTSLSGINGNYQFDYVSYETPGALYDGYVSFYDTNGNQAVDPYGSGVSMYVGPTRFYGHSNIPEFTEVTSLSGIWTHTGYIDSSGEFYATWDNPNIQDSNESFAIAAPSGIGTPTQSTHAFQAVEFAQPVDFLVWAFVPNIGHTISERNWPRLVDANGTWYYAGRTTNTWAHVHVPNSSTALWVGYGNKYTYSQSVLPWNNVLNSIYLL